MTAVVIRARPRWQKFLMMPSFVRQMMKLKVPFTVACQMAWVLASFKGPSGQIVESLDGENA